jgi:hypothetical protein
MKKIIVIFTLAAIALSGCGRAESGVSTELSASDIADVIAPMFDTGAMVNLDEARMQRELSIDGALVSEYIMAVPSGTNQDEYGVLVAADTVAAGTISGAVSDYFERRRTSWMNEYLPEERGKLDSAEVRSFAGKYVVYVIADADKAAAVFEAAETLVQTK